MRRNPERAVLGEVFDRILRSLHGLPDVATTKATTVRSVTPVLELSQTFIVQTYRHRERGDHIFVEYVGAEGSVRLALPPVVADVIARQRNALTKKNQRRAGKAEAARRKAAGIQPGFMRGRGNGAAHDRQEGQP
jgi:hypothetical protein